MPNADIEAIHAIGQEIEDDVVPILQEANEYLPVLEELDLALYTITLWPMAVSYSFATTFALEAMEGASEHFREVHSLLDTCADAWSENDEAIATSFETE